jgi:hypothetical protein
MTTRFDLVSPRKGKDDKTRWFKVGAAFPRDKGGYQLVFDALPLPDAEGRVTLMMWEAQERDGQSSQARAADRAQRPTGGAPAGADMDDEIPFIMEWR